MKKSDRFLDGLEQALKRTYEREGVLMILVNADQQALHFIGFDPDVDPSFDCSEIGSQLLTVLATDLVKFGYLLNDKGQPFGAGQL